MKDFLFTLLAWLLTLPVIVASVAFAIYNAGDTPIILNPFRDAVPMPVYVPVLGAIAIGFLFGAIMTWAAMGRLRHERREQKKKIKALEKQLDAANQNQIVAHTPVITPTILIEKK